MGDNGLAAGVMRVVKHKSPGSSRFPAIWGYKDRLELEAQSELHYACVRNRSGVVTEGAAAIQE
jgi:hypothetical protein